MIGGSPGCIGSVLETVAESAARVRSAEDMTIRLVEGNVLGMEAHYGSSLLRRGKIDLSTVVQWLAERYLNVKSFTLKICFPWLIRSFLTQN